ncbi:MAG: ABC transporter ATP-binding protein [Clostridiales bacterium]|jgi:ABC-2 type transport system ATP-binding protein|nr:ABC transporter ATP-binding protein [Clostridiales bacterium]
MNTTVEIKNLNKSYGNQQVLFDISFTVNRGEIFALLGVNGAGKTTTLECIEGIRGYERGQITLNGTIGVQLQSSSLPQYIKAIEAVRLFAKWNHAAVDGDYLGRIGVSSFQNKKYQDLSTGQKRRLHLAIAMLGNPDIILLDEPTAGLDVEGRAALHEEIRHFKNAGKTIILASHDLSEVEELCDRIAILRNGEIAFIGTSQALTEQLQDTRRLHVRFSSPVRMDGLAVCVYRTEEQGYAIFEADNLTDGLLELSTAAKKQNSSIDDIKIERASLEQRFIDISREVK